jgi:hypothetical protein
MPTDKTKSPVTCGEMVELYNQLSIYIGKNDFKKIFWYGLLPIIAAHLEKVAESMETSFQILHSINKSTTRGRGSGWHYSKIESKAKDWRVSDLDDFSVAYVWSRYFLTYTDNAMTLTNQV